MRPCGTCKWVRSHSRRRLPSTSPLTSGTRIPIRHTSAPFPHSRSGRRGRGIADLSRLGPVHVAVYVEELGRTHSKPTVKQHLAAIRMLFDWLVVGQVIPVNPADPVRGP